MALPTVTEATTYHTLRDNKAWSGVDPDNATTLRSAAIVRASDYIKSHYTLFDGVDFDTDATIAEAIIILAPEMLTYRSLKEESNIVRKRDEIVGDIVEDTTYADSPSDLYPQLTGFLVGVASLRIKKRGMGLIRLVR